MFVFRILQLSLLRPDGAACVLLVLSGVEPRRFWESITKVNCSFADKHIGTEFIQLFRYNNCLFKIASSDLDMFLQLQGKVMLP